MTMGATWAEALEPGDLCLMSRGDVGSIERGLVSLHRGKVRIRNRVGLAALADGAARGDVTGGRSDGSSEQGEGLPRS